MKAVIITALLLIPASLGMAGTIYLLSIGNTEGWGWVLFATILSGSVRIKEK